MFVLNADCCMLKKKEKKFFGGHFCPFQPFFLSPDDDADGHKECLLIKIGLRENEKFFWGHFCPILVIFPSPDEEGWAEGPNPRKEGRGKNGQKQPKMTQKNFSLFSLSA